MQPTRRQRPHATPGAPPGTITIDPAAEKPRLDVLSYGPSADPASIKHQSIASIDQLPALPAQHAIRWVNICGLGDAAVLQAVGQHFNIHPLVLADVAHTAQRPKVETYDDYLFITTRIPARGNGKSRTLMQTRAASGSSRTGPALLDTDQLSICVGKDFVLTFQEHPDETFDAVRNRLMAGGKIQKQGTDYLAYAILDAAIDTFFPLLEMYGSGVDDLETRVIEQPQIDQIGSIHNLKRNLLTARRTIWPQREMLNTLMHAETPLVSAHTKLFLRDCYDHVVQLMDMIETDREIASGLVDILLSSQSNRMNQIMKVLTIIATIFIPLSWIAGVYGMNFETKSPWNMPELGWRYGYFYALGLMLLVACALLAWFWRRGWIGKERAGHRRTRARKLHRHQRDGA